MESELEKAHAEAWQAYRRHEIANEKPHVILRGKDESGNAYYVEILTWKDRNITMNPPADVMALWGWLEAACEARLGHRGIEFPEVQIVAAE